MSDNANSKNSERSTSELPNIPSLSTPRLTGIVVVSLALVGAVAAVLIPAMSSGETPSPATAGSAALGLTLWPYLLARLLRWKRAWSYPIFGLALYFTIAIGAGLSRGVERKAENKTLENRLIAAIEKFEPRLGPELRASRNDQPKLDSLIQPSFRRAVGKASDAAVFGVLEGTLNMMDSGSGINVPRCVSSLMGTTAPQPTQAEIDATIFPMIAVFESAAQSPTSVAEVDALRAEQLVGAVHARADPKGILQDPEKLSALTDRAKCDLFLRYMREVLSLPVKDAALMVRSNLSAG